MERKCWFLVWYRLIVDRKMKHDYKYIRKPVIGTINNNPYDENRKYKIYFFLSYLPFPSFPFNIIPFRFVRDLHTKRETRTLTAHTCTTHTTGWRADNFYISLNMIFFSFRQMYQIENETNQRCDFFMCWQKIKEATSLKKGNRLLRLSFLSLIPERQTVQNSKYENKKNCRKKFWKTFTMN